MLDALRSTTATPATENAGLHLVTVVWGEWYRTAFTELLLPTLMAPGNLPALKGLLPARITIHTTRHDATKIRSTASFQSLTEAIAVDMHVHDGFEQSISTHHAIWQRISEMARGTGEHIFFLPPDLICADGTMRHLAKLIAAGKRAIYCTAPRIASETFRAALHDTFPPDAGGAISASPRPLLQLMVKHFHPLNMSQSPDANFGTIYEEILYWPVGDKADPKGFISCSPMPGCFFVVRPDEDLRLGGNQVIEEGAEFDDFAFITESDDMLFLSVLPLMQYRETYLDQGPLRLINIAKTSLDHDSLTTEQLAKVQFRFRLEDGHSAEWCKAERKAAIAMGRVLVLKEFLRAWRTMRANKLQRAAELLAFSLHTLVRLKAIDASHVTAFVPSDESLAGLSEKILADMPPRKLAKLIADHIVPGTWRASDFAGRNLSLDTVGGRQIKVSGRGDVITVDGAPVRQADIETGHIVLHCVDTVLGDNIPHRSEAAAH